MKRAEPADFPKFEAELLKVWDQEKIFAASLEQRQSGKRFRFYDGPPFTSGEPHYGHVEQSAIKDAVVRYKTMRGYYVPRRTGSDTHGLPIEYLVEKELGFTGKQDIIKFGIDKFNQACRAIVFRHKADFEELYHRLGRWDDPKNSYATLDHDYIESVWWVFKSLYDKQLIYKGFKSMPYCPRCATPLSNFEVNDGYQDNIEDPSLYVKFKLKGEDRYLLAWTTTPWSLPGNAALAVNPKAKYVEVEVSTDDGMSQRLVLAADMLEVLSQDYKQIKQFLGQELVGLGYEALFEVDQAKGVKNIYQVWAADFVSVEDGTGILHVAPAFGEDDLSLGQAHDLPVLATIDPNGRVTGDIGFDEIEGMFFKETDDHIIEHLTEQNRVFSAERFKHTYPFCWRCETPLLYYATPSWFVAVSNFRDKLVKTGQATNWVPAHVKAGRFVKWLEGARDWAISRNRFWGSPIPVWQCERGHFNVIGSLEELTKRAVNMPKVLDLHRPGIDQIEVKCTECSGTAKRIEEVFDCWFESGSMPYGQDHYPFENKADFDASFPADFVVESIEQTHLWFYTLHVLATALFDQPAYQSVIASGLILGGDGRKLSKRLRNYPNVEEVFNQYGADVLRYFILASPLMTAGDIRLSQDGLKDVQRNIFMTLWNVHSFFTTYAAIDKWQPPKQLKAPASDNLLDQWLLARLNQTIAETTEQAELYQIAKAVRPITELIDDLSNWYVRRSRRRFWKSEDDGDKQAAYATLHYALVRICQLLAPWSPFVADKIWRELTKGMEVPASVHLSDWPEAGESKDNLGLDQMKWAREIIREALSQRAAAGIKVRQPLGKIELAAANELASGIKELIRDEVNVKEVAFSIKDHPGLFCNLDTTITPELKQEGLVRELIRHIQSRRKSAELEVDDRIELTVGTGSNDLQAAIKTFEDLIKTETLATSLTVVELNAAAVPVNVDGDEASIGLKKA